MKLFVTAIYNWYRNALRHPKYRWWIILGTLVYLLSPFDISPDVIPIFGEIDDFAIVALLMTEVSQIVFDHLKSRRNSPVSTEENHTKTVDVDVVLLD